MTKQVSQWSRVSVAPGLPSHFRQWIADKRAPSLREAGQLKTVQLLPPKSDEILVKTIYATINAGHGTFVARREGFFKNRTGVQELGEDSVGKVVAVGEDVSEFNIHDNVSSVFCRSFSEYTTSKAHDCVKLPKLSPDYAALRVAGTIAVAMMEYTVNVRPGNTILILAACGGVGNVAVQVAKANGCIVIGTCRNAAKKKALEQLDIDRIIDYSTESVEEVLSNEFPSGVDYVIDGVGGEMGRMVLRHLVPGGKLFRIGFFSMYPHTEFYEKVYDQKEMSEWKSDIENFWNQSNQVVGDRQIICKIWPTERDEIARCRKRAFDLYEQGKIKPLIDSYALEHFQGVEKMMDAVDYMLEGKNIGKMLVRL